MSGIVAQFLAKPGDMEINRAVEGFLGAAFDKVDQSFATDRAVRSLCHDFQ